MTAPTPPDPQEAADALADNLHAVTAGAATQATGELQLDLRTLVAALVARWVLEFGDVDSIPADTAVAGAFVEFAAALFAKLKLGPGAQAEFGRAVEDGYQLGREHSRRFTPPRGGLTPRSLSLPLPVLATVLDEQRAHAISGLDERVIADRGFPAVVQSTAKLARTTTRIEATVAYEVTRAANDAVLDATPTGWDVMWVAERDGCLHCLAYAGVTTAPGKPFPSGLTFGDRPQPNPGPLLSPPKHPHCRCCLQPLHPSDTAVSDGLKREARRSVLRGWSDDGTGSEGLRAADRLLAAGAGLPPTVEARARRAVADQRFN